MKKELENILMGNSAFVVDGVLNKNKEGNILWLIQRIN